MTYGSRVCESCNQLQKYLRHRTVFWVKWPVHDLVLVTPPPPLFKVASNTRPCSKLGGTTLNGGRREVSILSHRPVTSSDLRQDRLFFRESVSTFLQLVATSCKKYLRHCTVFWLKWPVHDILCLWPPLHPFSKLLAIQDHAQNLEEQLWMGAGGRSLFYLTDLWLAAIWSKTGCFFVRVSQHFCNWLW